ncbi:MAG TPA: hypothetical protein VNZ45_15275 [Bacteroidia bacterium]|nr:hypothetical protein [Bacteroidia bacterium]
MSANIISPATNINLIPGISYDLQWSGSPVGTFQVQVSNSYSQNSDGSVQTPGAWNTLPPSSFTGTYPVPAGSSGNGFLDVVGTECAWVRLVYTATSGTGSLTVIPAAKVF